jgi:hypothetical protein
VAQVLQRWRLVRPDRTSVRVRLVAARGGIRLEAAAGREHLLLASAQYSDGQWTVRMPLTRHTVRVETWPTANRWMLEELHSLLPGRLVPVGRPVTRPSIPRAVA